MMLKEELSQAGYSVEIELEHTVKNGFGFISRGGNQIANDPAVIKSIKVYEGDVVLDRYQTKEFWRKIAMYSAFPEKGYYHAALTDQEKKINQVLSLIEFNKLCSPSNVFMTSLPTSASTTPLLITGADMSEKVLSNIVDPIIIRNLDKLDPFSTEIHETIYYLDAVGFYNKNRARYLFNEKTAELSANVGYGLSLGGNIYDRFSKDSLCNHATDPKFSYRKAGHIGKAIAETSGQYHSVVWTEYGLKLAFENFVVPALCPQAAIPSWVIKVGSLLTAGAFVAKAWDPAKEYLWGYLPQPVQNFLDMKSTIPINNDNRNYQSSPYVKIWISSPHSSYVDTQMNAQNLPLIAAPSYDPTWLKSYYDNEDLLSSLHSSNDAVMDLDTSPVTLTSNSGYTPQAILSDYPRRKSNDLRNIAQGINIGISMDLIHQPKHSSFPSTYSGQYNTHSGFKTRLGQSDFDIRGSLFKITTAGGLSGACVLEVAIPIEITVKALVVTGLAVTATVFVCYGGKKLYDYYQWKQLPKKDQSKILFSNSLNDLMLIHRQDSSSYRLTESFKSWTELKAKRNKECIDNLNSLIEYVSDSDEQLSLFAVRHAIEGDNVKKINQLQSDPESIIIEYFSYIQNNVKSIDDALSKNDYQGAKTSLDKLSRDIPKKHYIIKYITAYFYVRTEPKSGLNMIADAMRLAKTPEQKNDCRSLKCVAFWSIAVNDPNDLNIQTLKTTAEETLKLNPEDSQTQDILINTLIYDFKKSVYTNEATKLNAAYSEVSKLKICMTEEQSALCFKLLKNVNLSLCNKGRFAEAISATQMGFDACPGNKDLRNMLSTLTRVRMCHYMYDTLRVGIFFVAQYFSGRDDLSDDTRRLLNYIVGIDRLTADIVPHLFQWDLSGVIPQYFLRSASGNTENYTEINIKTISELLKFKFNEIGYVDISKLFVYKVNDLLSLFHMTNWIGRDGNYKTALDFVETMASALHSYDVFERAGNASSFDFTLFVASYYRFAMQSRKVNRQFLFEHPACYLLSDVALALSLVSGSAAIFSYVTGAALSGYALSALESTRDYLLSLEPLTAVGLTIGLALTVYIGKKLSYRYYAPQMIFAKNWNAEMFFTMHQASLSKAEHHEAEGHFDEANIFRYMADEEIASAISLYQEVLGEDAENRKAIDGLRWVTRFQHLQEDDHEWIIQDCLQDNSKDAEHIKRTQLYLAQSYIAINKIWLAEKRLLGISDGYDLLLMSNLASNVLPEKNKIYIEKCVNDERKLRYVVLDPKYPNKRLEATLEIDIGEVELTGPLLNDLKSSIISETLKRGHTLHSPQAQIQLAIISTYYGDMDSAKTYAESAVSLLVTRHNDAILKVKEAREKGWVIWGATEYVYTWIKANPNKAALLRHNLHSFKYRHQLDVYSDAAQAIEHQLDIARQHLHHIVKNIAESLDSLTGNIAASIVNILGSAIKEYAYMAISNNSSVPSQSISELPKFVLSNSSKTHGSRVHFFRSTREHHDKVTAKGFYLSKPTEKQINISNQTAQQMYVRSFRGK